MNIQTVKINLSQESLAILEIVLKKKGHFATIHGARPLKVQKRYLDNHPNAKLMKWSTFQLRLGVRFEALSRTQSGRKNGELPAENSGLPFYFKAVYDNAGKRIHSLVRHHTTGKLYIAGEPIWNNRKSIRTSRFAFSHDILQVDPYIMTRDELKGIAYANDLNVRDGTRWIYYNIENVTALR